MRPSGGTGSRFGREGTYLARSVKPACRSVIGPPETRPIGRLEHLPDSHEPDHGRSVGYSDAESSDKNRRGGFTLLPGSLSGSGAAWLPG